MRREITEFAVGKCDGRLSHCVEPRAQREQYFLPVGLAQRHGLDGGLCERGNFNEPLCREPRLHRRLAALAAAQRKGIGLELLQQPLLRLGLNWKGPSKTDNLSPRKLGNPGITWRREVRGSRHGARPS